MAKTISGKYDVIIIGAGASGLMAAYEAAGRGCHVLVIERNDRAGKKLSLTGNGKCNFTNENFSCEFFHSSETQMLFDKNSIEEKKHLLDFSREINAIFNKFSKDKIVDFFESIGIPAYIRNGYYYPLSSDAKAFRDLFFEAVKEKETDFLFSERVISVSKDNDIFEIRTENNTYFSDKVIVSSGGLSYPKTGSTGDSYTFASSFGIKMAPRFPALVPLRTGKDYSASVDGVRCHALASLCLDNHLVYSEEGEIQFNKDNVSGLPVLSLSGTANRLIYKGEKPYIVLDLFPDSTSEKLLNDVSLFLKSCGKERPLGQALSGYLPYKLIPFVLEKAGLNVKMKASLVTGADLNRFVSCSKALRISITGSLGFDRAQTTTGGVLLSEVDLDTMEAMKVPGLYFTGEALDIDGICGGYNLSFAFATGYIAGNSI